jgi:glycosyltransferase involved in cell wall biosynthesis
MSDFSIIIPCFNAEATIADTLESISAQSHPNWEVVCIDDGSTDATAMLITAAAQHDPRIRLVRNPGKGPSDARNAGVMDYANGRLIAFCDADDLWKPTKLRELVRCFADQSVDGCFGQIGFFKDTPADATVFSTVPTDDLSVEMLLAENPVCTMSNMAIRKSVFVASGGFDRHMIHNEDLEWLIRVVGGGGRVVGLTPLQTWYRTSIGGLSTDLSAMLSGREKAIKTAARFGVRVTGRAHAVHHRYLARRALRLGAGRCEALKHALRGVIYSPAAFLHPIRRGGPTLAAALIACVLPRSLRQSLFS